EPMKGQQACLDALALLRDRDDWTCWQVGGAQRPSEVQYLESLRSAVARLGIGDRVRFLGQRLDIAALLSAADRCGQPNLEPDACGIRFGEALGAGLPVVTSKSGGALEIVDSTCGVLLDPGDRKGLAGALESLVAQPLLRAKMGEAGRARARALCD